MLPIRLQVTHANSRVEEHALGPGKYVLGREDCDIVIGDENVSARHAEIHVREDGVVLRDLGSRNGTYDGGGRRISVPQAMRPNETIRLGASRLTWVQTPAPAHRLQAAEQRMRRLGLTLFWCGTGVGALLSFELIFLPALASENGHLDAMLQGALFALPAAGVYLTVPRLLDRFDPEPWYALAGCLAWGAFAAFGFSALVNTQVIAAVSEVAGRELGVLAGVVISAPLVEELSKGLAVLGMFRFLRREFDGVVDGIIYATFTAIGFAAVENVDYYARAALAQELEDSLFMRGVLTPWCHPVFTAMTGIGLGLAREATRTSLRWVAPIIGLVAAVGLHAFWNGVAMLDGFVGAGFFAATLPLWVMFVAGFFGLTLYLVARRGRIIRRFLEDEIHAGNLSRAEVERVCHPFGLTLARLQQGPFGVEFLRAAARLALSKWHFARAAKSKKVTLSADFIVPLRRDLRALRGRVSAQSAQGRQATSPLD